MLPAQGTGEGGSEPPLLEVSGLVKRFGALEVLRGVNFGLAAGALRCIIGPNGCGKTTLFNIISGAFPPTTGTARYRGRDITGWRPHEIARLGIARKFQVPGIYPNLTAAENLEVALTHGRRVSAGRPWWRAGGSHGGRIAELLATFGLAAHAERAAGTLAHGLKQWLELAMLMGTAPDLLLLDEPTAGMSAAETQATAELIRRIQRASGTAVLVIEHDMQFVRQLECPVIVMLRGAVLFEGSFADIEAHPEVREAYLGQALAC